MRFWSDVCAKQQWFLTLFFQELGQPTVFRVGQRKMAVGGLRDRQGIRSLAQIPISNQPYSVELYPGSRLYGMVVSDRAGINLDYRDSLTEHDMVELTSPSDIVVMPADLAQEVTVGNGGFDKQLQVLNGRRRRLIA